jgi:hypothetical protein
MIIHVTVAPGVMLLQGASASGVNASPDSEGIKHIHTGSSVHTTMKSDSRFHRLSKAMTYQAKTRINNQPMPT